MAQLVSVKLSRFDSQPWGFRLQGGKDFAQPLVVQKVNGSSLAEKAGLQAGDAVIRVNSEDVFNLSHKDAQNALVRAGNSFELTVQRGGSTWRPSVTPVGPAPTSATSSLQPVTKTSLAYNQPPAPAIGSAHNTAAKPFGGQFNGESAKNMASKLYNSPVGLYSEETIAETLSAQTEVLASGALGVNFKKNEKTYNAANSEVLKMVQDLDNEPREPEPAPTSLQSYFSTSSHAVGAGAMTPRATTPQAPPKTPQPPPDVPVADGTPKCTDCQRFIVGLFVRIKDKNLHVECFKCATCGTSLKNVGYYNISNKLYCDVHAKLVARQNPPAPNLEPITVPPGVKPPSSIIGSALSGLPAAAPPAPLPSFSSVQPPTPGSPLPGTLGPLPFHAGQSGIRHVTAPRSVQFQPQAPAAPPAAPIQAPKLNLSQPAVCPPGPGGFQSTAPRPLSESQESTIQYQSYSTVSQSSYSSASQSTSYGASSQVTESSLDQASMKKKLSICSQEVDGIHMDARNVVKQLSEILEEHDRCASPTPIDEVVDRVTQQKVSKEEKIQMIERQEQWKNYQTGQQNTNVTMQGSSLAFLRSHSTPVAELEALYEQQQREIEEHKVMIQHLGQKKRMSIDETQIRELENLIIENECEIEEKQKKQAEIENKKRVHFQIEEEKESEVDNDQALAQAEKQRELERQENERLRAAEENKRLEQERSERERAAKQEEAKRRQLEEDDRRKHLLSVEFHREHAKTPVAELEAYERHDNMSRKTETIFHTYEHLVQAEEEEEDLVRASEIRPVTPCRAASPMPGSIPGAEVNLLLKNIQGIQFEFDLNSATGKKPAKTFKLPDLRNLSAAKPYAPAPAAPAQVPIIAPPAAPPLDLPVAPIVIPPLPSVAVAPPAPAPVLAPKIITQPPVQVPQAIPATKQPERTQEQQIKEQRKQVHEELALNERFRKKQERLGVVDHKFERSKTPVAELEDESRHHQCSERTHHVFDSYDRVIEAAERPRSRIGLPMPENQAITDAEKSLFFQNISGINYEFENISELTAMKHLPTEQKSLFIRDTEQRTKSPVTVGVNDFSQKPGPMYTPKPDPYQSAFVKALTTMPDPSAKAAHKTYEEFRHEQEMLYQQQKQQQKSYCEQQQSAGIGENRPKQSSMLQALIIAPDRPYSPLPSRTLVEQVPPPVAKQPAVVAQRPPAEPIVADVPPPFIPEPLPEFAYNEQPKDEIPKYDGARRRSSGFPGVNVQRTPYQMLRGSQIQSSFMEDLTTQQSSISQFLSETEEAVTKVHRKDTIDASFGLMPSSSQVVYAPPPPPAKRAELVAAQSQFGSAVEVKTEKTVTESKALSKNISMAEALTIAPADSYIPFAELPKPQATLIYGGASVALTKPAAEIEKIVAPPPPPTIEIKPCYEVKDLQLQKTAVTGDYSGFVEEKKQTSAEAGIIKGENTTGTYERKEEQTFNAIQLQKSVEAEVAPPSSFPPVSQELKAEFTELSQSSSSQQSSEQTEKVETIGDVVKTTKRRVVEVAESSHKEMTQVRVIGGTSAPSVKTVMGSIDPISGLRRTSNEVVSNKSSQSYQSTAVSGLSKPVAIPSYQNFAKPADPLPAAAVPSKVDSKDFKPRPRSVIGEKVSAPADKVPVAFRTRTPVPLPKIDFVPKTQPAVQQPQRNLPTYNQDQVYRSASPRPIPVPKAQFGSYTAPAQPTLKAQNTVYRTTSPLPVPSAIFKPTQPQQAYLKPGQPTVYRSTSPVPVPKMVKTNESYQQPMPGWRVQPVKNEKRVSWPPTEGNLLQQSTETQVVSQSSVRSKVSQQEEQTQRNVQEARRSSMPTPTRQQSVDRGVVQKPVAPEPVKPSETPVETAKSVREMITQKEQQSKINEEEARRSSLVKSTTARRTSEEESRVPRTSLAGKQAPGPKHDPIIAPRPFGTPTPQRRIATPHFQPITPVAVTEGPSAPISAPKLSFSSQMSMSSNIEQSKVTLTNSLGSAFKPLDTIVPVKPVAYRPAPPPTLPSPPPPASVDNGAGAGAGGAKGATFGGVSAPRRGRGILNQPNAGRIALCAQCNGQVRGPFITALGKIWCPDHFLCSTPQCRRPLADIGFVEEQGGLHCEFCFEKYIAPNCDKCNSKIKGDCLNAIGKHFHPECFTCAYCSKLFGNSAFYLEDGLPYCENDWNELFTTKCFACGFPIEAGDRWVEALNNNYHSQCFNCAVCKKNLEGQSFFAKGGRPFCKAHAR